MVAAAMWATRVPGLLSSAIWSRLSITSEGGHALLQQPATQAASSVSSVRGCKWLQAHCPGSQLSLRLSQARAQAEGMHWMQANNPQAMSNALWAYATLRYDPGPQLMEAATLQLMDKLDLFNPQVAPHAPSSTLNPEPPCPGLLGPDAGAGACAGCSAWHCLQVLEGGTSISWPVLWACAVMRQGLPSSLCRGSR